ncbi:monovalent cation/H(+) antiporter subunit G [Candidatus Woesearchaeota archaeon]|nr:monovalent cation/H(+) antiporter subunit G [Candidatus Woesearchaeota archaeon]
MTLYLLLVLVGIGLIFNILAVVGLLRFPDVYTRLHAATKCTTFGTIFVALAVMVYGVSSAMSGVPGFGEMSVHALVALIVLLLTNPTGAHAIAQAAHRYGIKPEQAVVDALETGTRNTVKKAGVVKKKKGVKK